jgi:hypothetical protein
VSLPAIPWAQGETIFLNSDPGKPAAGGALVPGRWGLSTRSTVPFVEVQVSTTGLRVITWGEVLEIPDGQGGKVVNASAHKGDIRLSSLGVAGVPPPRPRRVTLAVQWTVNVTGNIWRTQAIDGRTVVRAFLAATAWGNILAYTVYHRAALTGTGFNTAANSQATIAGGVVADQHAIVGVINVRPLGIGTTDYTDANPGKTVPEWRPQCLLDSFYVETEQPPSHDAFFLLEY